MRGRDPSLTIRNHWSRLWHPNSGAPPSSLLVVQNGLRCRFAQFYLCVHFLQARSKQFNLLLQSRDFPVLFQELVEERRVDPLVARRQKLAVLSRTTRFWFTFATSWRPSRIEACFSCHSYSELSPVKREASLIETHVRAGI